LLGVHGVYAARVLVRSRHDPVDPRVAANGVVLGVNHDDLEELVNAILVNPVRVEHAQAAVLAPRALLGDALEGALELDLRDSLGVKVNERVEGRGGGGEGRRTWCLGLP